MLLPLIAKKFWNSGNGPRSPLVDAIMIGNMDMVQEIIQHTYINSQNKRYVSELVEYHKNISNNRFSCLLDDGIAKISKKLKSQDGFLKFRAANPAHLAAFFTPSWFGLKKPS